jgi:4-aminobutyrate aminotransferase/(S)-3-amino-2-methylpropionate transaminase
VAALEALRILESPGFLEQARSIERIIRETFEPLQKEIPVLGDVRGVGAMMVLEFVKDPKSKEPWQEFAMQTIQLASRRGVILIRAGLYTNCIRFLPALDIPEDMLREALGVVAGAIRETYQTLAVGA